MINTRLIIIYCCSCLLFSRCDSNSANPGVTAVANVPASTVAAAAVVPMPAAANHDLKEYVKWVKDPASGLIASDERQGYTFELSYRPALLEALSGLSGGEKLDDAKLNRLTKEYGGLQYYHLRIYENGDKIDNLRFNEQGSVSTSEYFAYQGEKHFSLIQGKDTLDPVLYHFENTYPHVPYLSFVLAFKDETHEEAGQRTLVINDLALPGNAPALSIDNASIINQPKPKNINQVWH